MAKMLVLVLSAGILLTGVYIYDALNWQPPLPVVEDIVWKEDANADDLTVSPYTISITQQKLDYLRQRLQNITLTPPLEGISFEYGMNTNQLLAIVDYWRTEYDWRKSEKLLNSVPHFRTKISGLNIHFIRVKPNPKLIGDKKVIPLLLLHGWPGSIKEFYKLFPLLTNPRREYNFVFEVIAPSLPGYAFSDAATKPGLNSIQIGLIMKKLMNRLGFEKFYIQGGDWGSEIGKNLATVYADSVLGFHSNMCCLRPSPLAVLKWIFGSFFPSLIVDKSYERDLYPMSDAFTHMLSLTGYLHLQATKPDTLGVALIDSPVGLATYILEKFIMALNLNGTKSSDARGGLEMNKSTAISIDDLLDNLMIYWATDSITSTMRLYAEHFSSTFSNLNLDRIPTFVPTVCANYPRELIHFPESILKEKFKNLLHVSHLPKGGHFAAFEQPVIFSNDLWKGICIIQNHISNTQHSC